MAKIYKEPLLYFLLLGGAIFTLFQQISDEGISASTGQEELVITQGHIQTLQSGFEKVWQRSPTGNELQGLIQSYIREEVLYREAKAMGLDRGDPIVRRRLRQKLEFLTEDLVGLEEPGDKMLQAYLNTHLDRYRSQFRYSFRQVYLNTNKRGINTQADALALLERLRVQDTDWASVGDSLMLQQQFDNETESEVERVLGRQFIQGLKQLETGSWQGPVVSGFGVHLIYVSGRIEGVVPELNEVRDAVFRDWAAEKREQAKTDFYQTLRNRYTVTIEKTGDERLSQVSDARKTK